MRVCNTVKAILLPILLVILYQIQAITSLILLNPALLNLCGPPNVCATGFSIQQDITNIYLVKMIWLTKFLLIYHLALKYKTPQGSVLSVLVVNAIEQ